MSSLTCLGQRSRPSVLPQLLHPDGGADPEPRRRQEEASLWPHGHHKEWAGGTRHKAGARETWRGPQGSRALCLRITGADPGWFWSRGTTGS